MIEGGLDFIFAGDAIKYDETLFYHKYKSYMPEGKGVDFISNSEESLLLLEVKNCLGYENDNIWRTKTDTIRIEHGIYNESFDIEVAKKVNCTLACLMGVNISFLLTEADELRPYFNQLASSKFARGKKTLRVVLYLEGNFGSKSRTKKMIMKRLQDKICEKLKWLNCVVQVVDSDTYNSSFFEVKSIITSD